MALTLFKGPLTALSIALFAAPVFAPGTTFAQGTTAAPAPATTPAPATAPAPATTPAPAPAQPGAPRSYTIATGGETRTSYAIGVAMALLARINLKATTGMDMQAITSSGSIENAAMMRDGRAQFAIMPALIGQNARAGTGPFDGMGPQLPLRAVAMLWPEAQHFLISTPLATTGTADDLANLAGHGFSLGPQGAATAYIDSLLFANFGLDTATWNPTSMSFADALKALQNSEIGGVNLGAAIGSPDVTQALTTLADQLTLLTVTDDQVTRFDNGSGVFHAVTIPPGTYPGQSAAVQTIATPVFLAVNSNVSEEDVYQFTKTIFENLPYLCGLNSAACAILPETALVDLPVPLHPGAARYFREVGVAIPGEAPAPQTAAQTAAQPTAQTSGQPAGQ